MSPPPGAYELEIGVITLALAVPALALFAANRDLFPIAQREPLMALASNVAHTVLVAIGLLEVVTPGEPVFVRKIITQVCFGVTLGVFLVRVWKLYMDAGIANERVSGKHGWFVDHRHYRSRKFLLRFVAVILLAHGTVLTISLASSRYNLDNVHSAPKEYIDGIMSAALVVCYFLSFAVFSVKLAGAQDGFYLKAEYRMVGFGSSLVCVIWLIFLITKFDCAISSCIPFILWINWLWMVGFSIVFPLVLAARDRRFGLFRCFEKRPSRFIPDSRASLATRESGDSRESQPDEHSIQLETPRAHHRNFSAETYTKLRHLPLSKFLAYSPGKEAFRTFIVREFSVENLLFVEAVLQLQGRQFITKEEADALYNEFIARSAPSQVNLPGDLVVRLEARMTDEVLDAGLFDVCAEHVMKLMQRDAYRRFQKTPEWQQHIAVFDDKEVQAPQPIVSSITTVSDVNERASEGGSETTARETLPSEICLDVPTPQASNSMDGEERHSAPETALSEQPSPF